MDTSATIMGRNEMYSNMNGGKPFSTYKKTILALAKVTVWDNFLESPTEILLKGDPRKNDEGCLIDVWTEKEKVFFERMNKNHFTSGVLIPYQRPVVEESTVKSIEQYSDDELREVVSSKFLAFQATLNKINTISVLFRIKSLAEEADKSEKIMKAIEARISEIQNTEFTAKPVKEE